MSRKAAQVVSGARGPETRDVNPQSLAEQSTLRQVEAAQRAAASKKSDEVVYQSKASNLRIQLTAPASSFDPRTGRISEDKPQAAQFREGVFRVKADAVLPDGQLVTERLESKSTYGVNRDFWRVEDMTEYRRAEEAAEFARKLESDPELRRLVAEKLGPSAEEFAPPAQDEPASTPES